MDGQQGTKSNFKSEYHRDLILVVCDDYYLPLERFLQFLASMVRSEEACLWLIKNDLVGRRLHDWIIYVHDDNVIGAVAAINKGLDKYSDLRPVYAGKDIRNKV